jgi:hypothetical protein
MFDKKQAIFTYVLTNGIFTVNETDGITAVAIKLLSGAGTYMGTKMVNGIDSTATPLVVDKGVTISSEQTKYIDNLVIDASAGSIEIIAR